jgi:hypothetical protein
MVAKGKWKKVNSLVRRNVMKLYTANLFLCILRPHEKMARYLFELYQNIKQFGTINIHSLFIKYVI